METTWTHHSVATLFELPFSDLLYHAQTVHRSHFKPNEVELCALLSIKTGSCPEDCAYCPQSGHYQTGLQREKLLSTDEVLAAATIAKANGATRFCMGAAWRNPPKKNLPDVINMIKAVKKLGLETCVTLGTLDEQQANELKAAGLDYYNHNLDTSPEYYKKIITTRTYDERLTTLQHVRDADIHVCCGGIIGMGESREDRIEFLLQLANLPEAPKSVPINRLIAIPGTPLENQPVIDNIEFVRTVAAARIMIPTAMVRLSAGRESMSDEMQTLCFLAGANSIFFGDTLLTAKNPETDADLHLFNKLGMATKSATRQPC